MAQENIPTVGSDKTPLFYCADPDRTSLENLQRLLVLEEARHDVIVN